MFSSSNIKGSVYPACSPELVLLVLLPIAILTGVRWCLKGVLISMSLIVQDIEHFFHILLSNVYFGGLSVHFIISFIDWAVCVLGVRL